jgi:hypothetical protein
LKIPSVNLPFISDRQNRGGQRAKVPKYALIGEIMERFLNGNTLSLDTLASAWEFYETLKFNLVPCHFELRDGKKKTIFMPKWQQRQFTVISIRPQDNVLAVKTGDISGIIVIDIDIRDEEKRNILLCECKIKLELFTHVITPSFGIHVYVKSSQKLRDLFGRKSLQTTNKDIGIDVRDNGGLIFMPPSHIEGYGSYRWGKMPSKYEEISDYDDAIVKLLELVFASDTKPPANSGKLPFPEIKPRPVYSPARSYPYYDEEDFDRASDMVDDLFNKDIPYDDWRDIGYSLYSKFGEYGKVLWDRFLFNRYYNNTQDVLDSMWRSFANVHSINFGTLVFMWRKYAC